MSVLAEASRLLTARLTELDAEIDTLAAERVEVLRALHGIERPHGGDRSVGRRVAGTVALVLQALRALGPCTAPQVAEWLRDLGHSPFHDSHRPAELARNALQRAILQGQVYQPRRAFYALVPPESDNSGTAN